MGQEYQFRVYFNTGFNRFNRPDSLTLLQTATSKMFASPYLRQDKFIQSVKIDASFQEVEGADYATIGTTAFFVTSIQMIADHTANLTLEIDSLATVGIANLSIIGGWVKRRHVADDPLWGNDINEPFQPKQELVMKISEPFGFTSPKNFELVASTISLAPADLAEAKEFITSNGSSVVTPAAKAIKQPTVCGIGNIDGEILVGQPYTLPGTALFNIQRPNSPLLESLSIVHGLSQDHSITASYFIPVDAWAYGDIDPSSGALTKAIGRIKEVAVSGISLGSGPYKNKKVYSGQFQQIQIANIASGSSVDFKPETIQEVGSDSLTVELYADPSPAGKAYCRPKFFRSLTDKWIGTIAGVEWLNAPIRYEQSTGWATALKHHSISIDRQVAEMTYSVQQEYMLRGEYESNPLKWLGNIGEAFKSVTGMQNIAKPVISELNRRALYDEQLNNAGRQMAMDIGQMSIEVNRPEVAFPQNNSMSAYFGHTFVAIQTKLSSGDMSRFDKFLTMYGYAVDEPFTADALTCRQKFNYIALQDAQIKTPGYGFSIKADIESILTGGVRIWHKLPDAADYNDNPIVEVTK